MVDEDKAAKQFDDILAKAVSAANDYVEIITALHEGARKVRTELSAGEYYRLCDLIDELTKNANSYRSRAMKATYG